MFAKSIAEPDTFPGTKFVPFQTNAWPFVGGVVVVSTSDKSSTLEGIVGLPVKSAYAPEKIVGLFDKLL